jgi:hypothetical protein
LIILVKYFLSNFIPFLWPDKIENVLFVII